MAKIQSLGIDLGTSNCALALATDAGTQVMEITQILGAGRIGEESGFASGLYMPHEGQFPEGSMTLPWSEGDVRYVLGNYAREMGVQVPDRYISSAKSWLANRNVDARRPLLPWNSESVEQKLSALETSRLYLQHLRQAFEADASRRQLPSSLAETEVILTVPASFDEAARRATARAAVDAGWGEEVVLLEEPQAAFYAWLGNAGNDWRQQAGAGDIILVCDIGGGTTDFSLIAVIEREGNLELERISVGRHILLGGDNMDLALAFSLRRQLEEEGKALDDKQFLGLVYAARKAKEQLFENTELDAVPLSVASRGAGLFAGTVSTQLTRELLHGILVNGFFARTGADELPSRDVSAGLQEFGLSYAADPVVSKHLAEFLSRSRNNVASNPALEELVNMHGNRLSGTLLHPDAVLFNGGVFRAEPLRRRVIELLQSWAPQQEVRELVGTDLDLAVARGASLYGHHKISGKGIRIRAGVSRSYYIGMESAVPAIPGYKPPIKAVCVAPQGMEEGQEQVLEGREFLLVTGTKVQFRFFNSAERAGDTVGTVVGNAETELEETTGLEMLLPQVEGAGEESGIPVKLHTRLNELGTLQLWMQHTYSDQRWELTFSVRTE